MPYAVSLVFERTKYQGRRTKDKKFCMPHTCLRGDRQLTMDQLTGVWCLPEKGA